MYTLRALCFVNLFVRPDSCKAEQTKDRLHEPGWGYRYEYEYGPLPWMPDQGNNYVFASCLSWCLFCACPNWGDQDVFFKKGNNWAIAKKS